MNMFFVFHHPISYAFYIDRGHKYLDDRILRQLCKEVLVVEVILVKCVSVIALKLLYLCLQGRLCLWSTYLLFEHMFISLYKGYPSLFIQLFGQVVCFCIENHICFHLVRGLNKSENRGQLWRMPKGQSTKQTQRFNWLFFLVEMPSFFGVLEWSSPLLRNTIYSICIILNWFYQVPPIYSYSEYGLKEMP